MDKPTEKVPWAFACMDMLEQTLPSLADNLALDEALLLQAEEGGGECLRLWHWPSVAVVLGAGCRLAEDVNEAVCQTDGVPIQRRSSGGGAVLLGPGCQLFSLVLCYDRHPALGDIHHSYRYILGKIAEALATLAPGIEPAGISDLAIAGRKFSGNSQQRKRRHLLHHGTLLFDFDVSRIGRYLKEPQRQPEYRQQRSHGEFVRNFPAGETAIKDCLCRAWQATTTMEDMPLDLVKKLTEEKYNHSDWIRRR
jgi:lipoate-protein ligase A